jgi:hypothetical protein
VDEHYARNLLEVVDVVFNVNMCEEELIRSCLNSSDLMLSKGYSCFGLG